MSYSNPSVEPGSKTVPLQEAVQAPAFADTINRIVAQIVGARGDAEALELLESAVEAFGCSAAVFASFVRDDATTRSCRYLISGGPALQSLCSNISQSEHDPWLAYARRHFEPRCSKDLEITPDAHSQRAFLAQAAELGFREALIVPSHCVSGPSRIGMLSLGSDQPGYFSDERALALLTVPASALSLHLHIWWHARLRSDLINRVPLTPAELDLARMLLQGLNSKQISRRLNVRSNTIDSQLARMARRLGVGSRRAAVELLREYGVI
jgi:DNA-binding CsgD family transcriptional regulator